MKATRRALLLANCFNLLVAIYLIIIAIVALIELRWYHQLTVTIRVRHFITTATSYSAFFLLIFVGLVLAGIFVASTLSLKTSSKTTTTTTTYVNPDENNAASQEQFQSQTKSRRRIILRQATRSEDEDGDEAATQTLSSNTRVICLIFFHLLASVGLVVILVVWLCNTGELVRDSISAQLELAFARYQFTNRSNHYSIAIDGMQDTNNCCGSMDYTDFPHQRVSGLSPGHYPGSCCGKNVFGVNARVLCIPEEIWRARQTVSFRLTGPWRLEST